MKSDFIYLFLIQTISYKAEHVIGTGSFGVVFQVKTKKTLSGDYLLFKTIVHVHCGFNYDYRLSV